MRGKEGLRGTNERMLVSDKADAVPKTQCTHCNTCFIYACSFACGILHTRVQTERELFLYALALHPLKENGEFVCVTYMESQAHKLLVHSKKDSCRTSGWNKTCNRKNKTGDLRQQNVFTHLNVRLMKSICLRAQANNAESCHKYLKTTAAVHIDSF